MKVRTTILLFFFIANNLLAKGPKSKSYNQTALMLYKNKNYFSALDKLARQYKTKPLTNEAQILMEKITQETGAYYFKSYDEKQLKHINIPETYMILAKRYLYSENFSEVVKLLEKIPNDNPLQPEKELVLGTVYYKRNNFKKALEFWNQCVKSTDKVSAKSQATQKSYYSILKDNCMINAARMEYKNGEFHKAIALYEKVPKASYKWPYTLIEKAWSYYMLKNYNRSLGILMTYNSPLLESYFMPEAEVLKALNYYKLCLYEDALKVIDRYYTVYAPQSEKLKEIIAAQKGSKYFYDIMFKPIAETEKSNKYLRNLVTQVGKRAKFNIDVNTLHALNAELTRDDKNANKKSLIDMKNDLEEQINHYVKVSMYNFINEMHSLSTEMFNIKLEILSSQRSLLYENKKLSKRGSEKNIIREKNQDFWIFQNAFWADELGEYSFGLESKCKKVSEFR